MVVVAALLERDALMAENERLRELADVRAEINDDLERELIRWRTLGRAVIDADPDDMPADGVTCLMVWRKAAEELLKG